MLVSYVQRVFRWRISFLLTVFGRSQRRQANKTWPIPWFWGTEATEEPLPNLWIVSLVHCSTLNLTFQLPRSKMPGQIDNIQSDTVDSGGRSMWKDGQT